MRIISEKALREYGQEHTAAELLMRSWINTVQITDWENLLDVKATFGNTDYHHDLVIFNVGGNNFCVIGIVEYQKHIVFICSVLS